MFALPQFICLLIIYANISLIRTVDDDENEIPVEFEFMPIQKSENVEKEIQMENSDKFEENSEQLFFGSGNNWSPNKRKFELALFGEGKEVK